MAHTTSPQNSTVIYGRSTSILHRSVSSSPTSLSLPSHPLPPPFPLLRLLFLSSQQVHTCEAFWQPVRRWRDARLARQPHQPRPNGHSSILRTIVTSRKIMDKFAKRVREGEGEGRGQERWREVRRGEERWGEVRSKEGSNGILLQWVYKTCV